MLERIHIYLTKCSYCNRHWNLLFSSAEEQNEEYDTYSHCLICLENEMDIYEMPITED